MLRKLTAAALLAVVAHADEAVVSPDGAVEMPAAEEAAASTEEAAPAATEEAAPATEAEGEAAPVAEAEGEATEGEAKEEGEAVVEKKDDGLGPDEADDDLSEFDPPPEEDLENKINTLLGLLENKNVDPKTKEQLETLMGQLKGLGMDSEGLLSALGGKADTKQDKKNQVTAEKLMTACAILSAQYNGATKSATVSQLRAIGEADSLAKLMEEGKAADMLPLIMGCAEELTQEELKKFNRNKLKKIPQRVIDASAEIAANTTKLAEFDADLFATLQKRMEVVVETLEQTAAAQKIANPLPSVFNMALIAGFFSIFMGLIWKFFTYQKALAAEKPVEKKVQSAKSIKSEQKKAAAIAKKVGGA